MLHYNARPFAAAHTNTFQQLYMAIPDHLAYSPQGAPSDFHLLKRLNSALRGSSHTDDSVKEAVRDWASPSTKNRALFLMALSFSDRCAKCIEEGDYTAQCVCIVPNISKNCSKRRCVQTFLHTLPRVCSQNKFSTVVKRDLLHRL